MIYELLCFFLVVFPLLFFYRTSGVGYTEYGASLHRDRNNGHHRRRKPASRSLKQSEPTSRRNAKSRHLHSRACSEKASKLLHTAKKSQRQKTPARMPRGHESNKKKQSRSTSNRKNYKSPESQSVGSDDTTRDTSFKNPRQNAVSNLSKTKIKVDEPSLHYDVLIGQNDESRKGYVPRQQEKKPAHICTEKKLNSTLVDKNQTARDEEVFKSSSSTSDHQEITVRCTPTLQFPAVPSRNISANNSKSSNYHEPESLRKPKQLESLSNYPHRSRCPEAATRGIKTLALSANKIKSKPAVPAHHSTTCTSEENSHSRRRPQQTSAMRQDTTTPRRAESKSSMPIYHCERTGMDANKDSSLQPLKLTATNYQINFHQLLHLEEEEHKNVLENKCNGLYSFHLCDSASTVKLELDDYHKYGRYIQFGYIAAQHLDSDKVAYVKQASEAVVIVLGNIKWKLDIVNFDYTKNCEKIFVGLKEDVTNFCPISERKTQLFDIKFVLKHSYFNRLHEAIRSLSHEVINHKLVPNNCSNFSDGQQVTSQTCTSMLKCVRNFVSFGEEEDQGLQFRALHKLLNFDSSKAPMLIIGSFGTGKTRLLARAAYEILQNDKRSKVLICAHHNGSVDSLIENYFGKMIEAGWKFGQLVRLISEGRYEFSQTKQYSEYYVTISQLMNKKCTDLRLVITTLYSSWLLLKYSRKDHFTHILIDEGAQTREPEAIIPLCLASKNTKIVIAGDHKQVGPATLVLGEQARERGLKYSLLERLHFLYSTEKLFHKSEPHCATLLTNFRSHHALLSLPSYLFYGSALVTAAEATTQLHPKTEYPIHFVCSSLNEEAIVENSINEEEAIIILEEIRKYVEDWPKQEWGPKNLRNICVMATTSNQRSQLKNKLRNSQYEEINGITVLKAYEIQGQEFQAVFLSTAELIDENGMPRDPTRSPCGQYVFNTVITRAKSLVVCVGNPFILLKVEKTMKNNQIFWRDYLRRCIISKTFCIPQGLQQKISKFGSVMEIYGKLQMLIFSDAESSRKNTKHEDSIESDSIINRIQEYVKKLPNYEKCKLQIHEQQQSNQVWKIVKAIDNSRDEKNKECEFEGFVDCELFTTRRNDAFGVPILNSTQEPQEPIVIKGFNSRRGAFHGDIVRVGIMGRHKTTGQKYGKVTYLIESRHPTKFVCTADRQNIINFYPIDKLEPAIVNLPKLSRYILQHSHEDFSEAQQNFITVFQESSLTITDGDMLPKIKELIPLEMASSLLFVVKVLSWSPRYRKPLGAVVEALPQTNSIFIMERLLGVAHDIHEVEQYKEFQLGVDELEESSNPAYDCLPVYNNAFTIDPPDAINLDDALSIMDLTRNSFKMSVLITNVAKHIKQDSLLDRNARMRGISVYGRKCSHMLPVELSTSRLSLLPEQCRDVLAVSATIKLNYKGDVIEVDDKNSKPKIAQVRSIGKLTYEDAQKIMNGEDAANEVVEAFNSHGSLKMKDALQLLYDIAMKIRINRVSDAAYNCSDVYEPGEENNWQIHLLVSELMIWANKKIAEFLYDNIPDLSILRRQLRPLPEDMKTVLDAHKDAPLYSMSLRNFASDEMPSNQLSIPLSTCVELKKAYVQNDVKRLSILLSDESRYPQLAIAHSDTRLISRGAEYVKTKSDIQRELYYHHRLNLNRYTHFTSPIRRYPDIVVQRLINALLSQSDISYTENDLQNLCTHFNKRLRAGSQFERDIRKVELAITCEESLEKLEVYLTRSIKKEYNYELCIPSGKYKGIVQAEDTSFDQSHLNCWKRQESKITWKIILVPLKSPNFLFESTRISQFQQRNPGDIVSMIPNGNTIEAKVFSVVEDDKGGKDVCNCKRKMVSYVADIEDSVKMIDLDTWKECNEFVKANSLGRTPVSIPDLVISQLNESSLKKNAIIAEFLKTPVICFDATRMFDKGETINVWMGKSIRNYIPSPGVHLIEVAPFVKVCLQHNKSPAMCFSDMQLRLTSKTFYHSEKEYVDLWCKALLAEASHDAVNTKSLLLLTDVPLVWPELEQPENCLDNLYYKPKQDLYFEISEEIFSFVDFTMKVKIGPGDLVCARYSVSFKDKEESSREQYAVYHFVVQDIDTKTVYMRPMGEYGCRVSPVWREVLKSNPPCELQIIEMPISFNRLFRRLKKSIEWSNLAVSVALGNNFDPVEDDYSHVLQWGNIESKKLNIKQRQAIKLALQNSFSLIQGPPGTGKSIVGAHLAYAFAMGNKRSEKKGCVLYCGPSNKAVDVVHDYFLTLNKQAKFTKLHIIRLYGRTHERLDFKDPIQELKLDVEDQDGKCQMRFKNDALHIKVRQLENGKVEKMERSFAELLRKHTIPSVTERKCLKMTIDKFEQEVLSDPCDIILCTCNETCSRRVLSYLKIAQCIVDECGMAHEPETLAAISLAEHAVLIGDHKQLQPVVKYQPARQCGLTKSLFERYAEMENDEIFTQLNVQYRMHPRICDIPSKLFYKGKLITDGSIQTRQPLAQSLSSFWPQGHDCPIMFCDVVGKEIDKRTSHAFKGDMDAHSKSNKEEANKTIEFINLLVKKHHLKPSDIAVLTPYAAQRQLIKELLDKHIKDVVVASIIESQGDEYNIVILNTVRSLPLDVIIDRRFVQPDSKWMRDNLGFVADPHQMNVGITRAKHGLIIIGNRVLLEYDKNWQKLIEIYKKCNCIR